MSDRVLRFPDRTWDELEGLPQPLRNTAHKAIFHLLEEPVPTLADPFPEVDPLPGAYRLLSEACTPKPGHIGFLVRSILRAPISVRSHPAELHAAHGAPESF